jgi:hypothetical protein
LLTVH